MTARPISTYRDDRSVAKYYAQRRRLWLTPEGASPDDADILMTPRSWFEISPQVFAACDAHSLARMHNHHRRRGRESEDVDAAAATAIDATTTTTRRRLSVVDIFCGCGGSTSALALSGHFGRIVGIDCDHAALAAARHNCAAMRGVRRSEVANHHHHHVLEWMHCDVDRLLLQLRQDAGSITSSSSFSSAAANPATHQTAPASRACEPVEDRILRMSEFAACAGSFDCAYVSPPWGGPNYRQCTSFVDLATAIPFLATSLELAIRAVAPAAGVVAVFLPCQCSVTQFVAILSAVLHRCAVCCPQCDGDDGDGDGDGDACDYFRRVCPPEVEMTVHFINDRSKAMTILFRVPPLAPTAAAAVMMTASTSPRRQLEDGPHSRPPLSVARAAGRRQRDELDLDRCGGLPLEITAAM